MSCLIRHLVCTTIIYHSNVIHIEFQWCFSRSWKKWNIWLYTFLHTENCKKIEPKSKKLWDIKGQNLKARFGWFGSSLFAEVPVYQYPELKFKYFIHVPKATMLAQATPNMLDYFFYLQLLQNADKKCSVLFLRCSFFQKSVGLNIQPQS